MRSELFEQTLKQHKDSLANELQGVGKHKQVELAVWDIELNESIYEHYFNAAWDYRQNEVDEQQAKVEELQKRLENLEKLKDVYRALSDKELDNCTEGLLKHIERLEMLEQALKGEG